MILDRNCDTIKCHKTIFNIFVENKVSTKNVLLNSVMKQHVCVFLKHGVTKDFVSEQQMYETNMKQHPPTSSKCPLLMTQKGGHQQPL